MPSREKSPDLILLYAIVASLAFFVIHLYITPIAIAHVRIADNGTYQISDFLYHFLIFRGLWESKIETVYRLPSQIEAMSDFFGSQVIGAMPIGLSPTALLFCAPFVPISRFSLPLVNSLWVTCSLICFLLAVACQLNAARQSGRAGIRLSFFAIFVLVFSDAMKRCLLLGQTALWGASLLLFLYATVTASESEIRTKKARILFLIVGLSIKLPYLLVALGVLIIFRRYYELFLAGLVLAVLCFSLAARFGVTLFLDYLEQLKLYSAPILPSAYSNSLAHETTVTFRSAFSSFFGAARTIQLSQAILVAIALLVVVLIFCNVRSERHSRQHRLVMLSYFSLSLFLPYLGAYEELLFLFPLGVIFLARELSSQGRIIVLMSLLLIAPVLNHNFLHEFIPALFSWTMKFAASLLLLYGINVSNAVIENVSRQLGVRNG